MSHLHSWQAGPYVPYRPSYGHDRGTPESLLLVCGCGKVKRVRLPAIGRPPADTTPGIDWEAVKAACEHDWLEPDTAPDNLGGRYCMKCSKTEPPRGEIGVVAPFETLE